MSIWVVVPAFNESPVIEETLSGLFRHFVNVVVVDDCSLDDTANVALGAKAHVCRHAVNLGQGAALQTGIDYAICSGAELIVTFDADGQHQPKDAAGMVEKVQKGGFDVVLGSRFLGSTIGMSGIRGRFLKLATAYTRLTTGLEITDTHNGLRVFTRAAAKQIRLRHNRMAHASEILTQIAKLKLHYAEHPITVIYSDYSKEKGQRLTGAAAILRDLLVGKLYR